MEISILRWLKFLWFKAVFFNSFSSFHSFHFFLFCTILFFILLSFLRPLFRYHNVLLALFFVSFCLLFLPSLSVCECVSVCLCRADFFFFSFTVFFSLFLRLALYYFFVVFFVGFTSFFFSSFCCSFNSVKCFLKHQFCRHPFDFGGDGESVLKYHM